MATDQQPGAPVREFHSDVLQDAYEQWCELTGADPATASGQDGWEGVRGVLEAAGLLPMPGENADGRTAALAVLAGAHLTQLTSRAVDLCTDITAAWLGAAMPDPSGLEPDQLAQTIRDHMVRHDVRNYAHAVEVVLTEERETVSPLVVLVADAAIIDKAAAQRVWEVLRHNLSSPYDLARLPLHRTHLLFRYPD